jgi:MYXO-CTERM domain-containing protein
MQLARPLLLAALVAVASAALAAGAAPAHAESPSSVVIRNDSHIGGAAVFPTGFAAGDIIAARLDLGSDFGELEGLELLFGGPGTFGLHPVTIKIWDDTAETLEPGFELFHMDTTLLASETVQSIQLFTGTFLPRTFRVGIILHESTPPMLAQDNDGANNSDLNLMKRGTGWQRAQLGGVTGDFILRARVRLFGPGPGPDPDPGPGPGGICSGGLPCPAGQFCEPETRSCTFECVTEDDCGGAFCNRFGQCVGEGGCCQTGGGGGGGRYAAIGLGLGVLALLLRRRRR